MTMTHFLRRCRTLILRAALVLPVALLLAACGGRSISDSGSWAFMPTDRNNPPAAERDAAKDYAQTVLDFVREKEAELGGGEIGFSLIDPEAGVVIEHRGDELYHAASTMKVPVMVEVFRRAEQGDWRMTDTVVVNPNFRSLLDNSPYVVDARDYMESRIGQPEPILSITEQMMIVSDNLATNILVEMCGAARITGTMRELGIDKGYVLRGVSDIPAYEAGFSNRLTASGLSRLLRAIEEGRVAGPESTEEMRRILLDQRFTDMIPRHLPEDVRVGHKTGSITGHRHDAAIVYPPNGQPYYLTVLTANVPAIPEDTEADGDNRSKRAVADISKLIWDERQKILK